VETAPTCRIIKRFPGCDPLYGGAGCCHEDAPVSSQGERVDPVPHSMTRFFGGRAGDMMAGGWLAKAETDRVARGHGWAWWE